MKKLLCILGIHNWEMTKYSIRKGRNHQIIESEGFDRECLWCEKEQELKRPIKYHPCKYVWR